IAALSDSNAERSLEDDALLGIAHLRRASLLALRDDDAKAAEAYAKAGAVFANERLHDYFLKAFGPQGPVFQDFIVAHCYLARGNSLAISKNRRESTAAFGEAFRRLRLLAGNPLVQQDPNSLAVVQTVRVMGLLVRSSQTGPDAMQKAAKGDRSNELVQQLEVAAADYGELSAISDSLKQGPPAAQNRRSLANVLSWRARVFIERGEFKKGLQDCQECLQVHEALRDKHNSFNRLEAFNCLVCAAAILAAAPDAD